MHDFGGSSSRGAGAFPQASSAASVAMPARDRFYVELKPGETTFVSWKKLLRESQKPAGSTSPASEPPAGAHPALEARIAPEVVKGKENLLPPPNRFSAVIEKIERLYQGESSDDELCDHYEAMDDDKYDTRDSFIDDTELNDYFSVENTRLKHSGFFVNKGKLEKETEPAFTLHGPKKRKIKDLKKLSSNPIEDVPKQPRPAIRLKAAARGGPSPILSSSMKTDAAVEIKTKSLRAPGWEMGKNIAMAVVENELNNVRANGIQSLEVSIDDRMMVDSAGGNLNVKNRTGGLIDINEPLETSALAMPEARDSFLNNGLKTKSIQRCIKDDAMESLSAAKRSLIPGKEVSPGRNKGTALEKAFLDLEKNVSELYPPSPGMREPEQGKRTRLPREMKQKLAKVARLAAKQGRIADDIMERLMGILGHVIRERTLKRHLKSMIQIGASAIREKEGRLQSIKKEVTEMIKSRVLSLQAQDTHLPNDLGGAPEKANGEGWYQWDHETEDKICDLYERYTEGMDDNKGPHLRKFYAQLAELWPDGLMDNSGIKLAVHRAKERKKKLIKANNGSDPKIRRRKPKIDDSSGDGLTLLQLFTSGERLTDSSSNEKLSSHVHDVQLPLQEKKRNSNKNGGNDERKSKILDDSLLMKKDIGQEVERVVNIIGESIPLPFSSGSSTINESFSSPLSSSLPPFNHPLPHPEGTTNGLSILPH